MSFLCGFGAAEFANMPIDPQAVLRYLSAMKLVISLALSTLFTLSTACKKDEAAPKAADKPAAAKTEYTCNLEVTKKTKPTFVGEANGDDEKKVEEAAWTAACEKIPEADRAGCRDQAKFTWSAGGGSMESGGKKSYSKQVTLTQVMPSFPGKGTSETSDTEACKTATAEACKAAGAAANCTEGSEWDAVNVMKSSTKTTLN